MGKIRDCFKKSRDTKGTFLAKMGPVKDRNGMNLTEAEDIRRGGKNTQQTMTKEPNMAYGLLWYGPQAEKGQKWYGTNRSIRY